MDIQINKKELETDILTKIENMEKYRENLKNTDDISNDEFFDILEFLGNDIEKLFDLCECYYCNLCSGNNLNTHKYQSVGHFFGLSQTEDFFCKHHAKILPLLNEMMNLIKNNGENKSSSFYLHFYHNLDLFKLNLF
jgi:hypothetical protein